MIQSLKDARQLVASVADGLDPDSRYISELVAIVDASTGVADLERRLDLGCRGRRHAGAAVFAAVFAAMSLESKLRCNLITAETALFRFAEGEIEASLDVIRERTPRKVRVLIVPCSHGEEAFTVAAFLLGEGANFAIRAFDVQPSLIAEARTGRLTFGYPMAYLATPGFVAASVLDRIAFEVGDAFDLPLADGTAFDLVLCRNFLGYFTSEKAAILAAALGSYVAPGGRLFLDSFCLGKTPAIGETLEAASLRRLEAHPVFARAPRA